MNEIESIQVLKDYDNAYRSGHPILADLVYDKIYKDAKKQWPNNEFFQKISTSVISSNFGKDVSLEYVMGSLENYHFYADKTIKDYTKSDDIELYLKKYDNGSGYVKMHKIDGLSLLVSFESNIFSHAELRGEDGIIGSDVSDKVKVILKNNLRVQYEKLILRGEIVLGCEPSKVGMKNRRNGAVGIMKREDFKNIEYLKIYFYEVVDIISKDERIKNNKLTVIDKLHIIEQEGLNCVQYEYYPSISNYKELAERISINAESNGNHIEGLYDVDGLVIVPNLYERENIKLPKGKVAFKKQASFIETIITDIEGNTSRTGKVIPTLSYEPIQYNGATLSNATGFNFGFIYENKIGIGTKVLVSRAQEVVPKIESVIESNGFQEFTNCSSCGSQLEWDENHVHLMCNNLNGCPVQTLRRIVHFFISMGVENFTESRFENLEVNSILDVYALKKEDLIKLDRWGETLADEFLKQIEKTKKVKPEQLLTALNIPFLGKSVSKLLIENFSWDDIKNHTFDSNKLKRIEGIGKKKADYIITGLISCNSLILKLEEIGVTIEETRVMGSLSGKKFCITGKLSKPRKEIESWIVDQGGINTGLKKCENMFLVCNNPSESDKYEKATKLGIPIISEEELYKM
jgi:DNA ligase (NAD+)